MSRNGTQPRVPIEVGSPRRKRRSTGWRNGWKLTAAIGTLIGAGIAIGSLIWVLSEDLTSLRQRVLFEAAATEKSNARQDGLSVRVRTLETTQAATQVMLERLNETLRQLNAELKELRKMHTQSRRRRRRR